MRLINVFAFLFLFFFVACNEEKEFLTSKPGEIVLDVRADVYSLNGKVLGKTSADILNLDDLLILPIDNELRKVRNIEQEKALRTGVPADEAQEVRLHIDDNLSYEVFYKIVATSGFSGYTLIRYVIGSNFKNSFSFKIPNRSSADVCSQSTRDVLELLTKRMTKNLSKEEIMDRRIKEKARQIECARKYIKLSLVVENKENTLSYTLSLNETGLTDGMKFHEFMNEDDLWKYIEDIRLRRGLKDKDDYDEIIVVLKKDVLLKNLPPIVKRLTSYGYQIKFAALGN